MKAPIVLLIAFIALAAGVAGGFIGGHIAGKGAAAREIAGANDSRDVAIKKMNEANKNDERSKLAMDKLQSMYKASELAKAFAENELRQIKETEKIKLAKEIETNTNRNNAKIVLLKDFSNFPEQYKYDFVRFNGIWVSGDFARIDGTENFAVSLSTDDGKYVYTSRFKPDSQPLAIIAEREFGRRLSVSFSSNKKVKSDVFCELTRNGNKTTAKIYRIATYNLAGEIHTVYDASDK